MSTHTPDWANPSMPDLSNPSSDSLPTPMIMPSSDNNLPSSLDELRALAEDFAHIEYAQGPGQYASMSYTTDVEENKKRKKKKSAYITRYRQKHYENLLERRVAISEMEMRMGCEMKKELMGTNGQLKEQLRMLEKMVGCVGGDQGVARINADIGLQKPVERMMPANTENVVANVVAEEEAADLTQAVANGIAFNVDSNDASEAMDNSWMDSLTATSEDTDVETQTSDGSASLSSMHNVADNVFDRPVYTKPSYEDFMIDEGVPLMDQNMSNFLATLAKAA